MRRKQKKLLKSIFLGLTFLILLVIGFGYLKAYLDGIQDDYTSQRDNNPISVYVDSEKVYEDHRVLFKNVGEVHNISVKYTETNQFYNEKLFYTVQFEEALLIEDAFEDDLFVSVNVTSLVTNNNDFYLQIENGDGSFIFTLIIRLQIVPATDISIPDITFY